MKREPLHAKTGNIPVVLLHGFKDDARKMARLAHPLMVADRRSLQAVAEALE
jgi:uncharacterized alpha/beta hydrolase family protein